MGSTNIKTAYVGTSAKEVLRQIQEDLPEGLPAFHLLVCYGEENKDELEAFSVSYKVVAPGWEKVLKAQRRSSYEKDMLTFMESLFPSNGWFAMGILVGLGVVLIMQHFGHKLHF